MPAVKPRVTSAGMNCASRPAREKPSRTWSAPHSRVATTTPATPCFVEMSSTVGTSAASGPVTWRRPPPSSAAMTPATAPLMRPTSGGSPEATASARFSGSATHATVRAALASLGSVRGDTISFHSVHNCLGRFIHPCGVLSVGVSTMPVSSTWTVPTPSSL